MNCFFSISDACLGFIDSYRFPQSKLDCLATLLICKDFKTTRSMFSCIPIFSKKFIHPSEYFFSPFMGEIEHLK